MPSSEESAVAERIAPFESRNRRAGARSRGSLAVRQGGSPRKESAAWRLLAGRVELSALNRPHTSRAGRAAPR